MIWEKKKKKLIYIGVFSKKSTDLFPVITLFTSPGSRPLPACFLSNLALLCSPIVLYLVIYKSAQLNGDELCNTHGGKSSTLLLKNNGKYIYIYIY